MKQRLAEFWRAPKHVSIATNQGCPELWNQTSDLCELLACGRTDLDLARYAPILPATPSPWLAFLSPTPQPDI